MNSGSALALFACAALAAGAFVTLPGGTAAASTRYKAESSLALCTGAIDSD